jgi:hypothetical protein
MLLHLRIHVIPRLRAGGEYIHYGLVGRWIVQAPRLQSEGIWPPFRHQQTTAGLRQEVLANFRQKLARAVGLRHIVITPRRLRDLLLSVERIRSDRDDRDRSQRSNGDRGVNEGDAMRLRLLRARRKRPCDRDTNSLDKIAPPHRLPRGLGLRPDGLITSAFYDQRNGVQGQWEGTNPEPPNVRFGSIVLQKSLNAER